MNRVLFFLVLKRDSEREGLRIPGDIGSECAYVFSVALSTLIGMTSIESNVPLGDIPLKFSDFASLRDRA